MAETRQKTIDPPRNERSRFAEGYEAGRQAYLVANGSLPDPAGENDEHDRLRAMGKWRFILIRGIAGFGVPMFLWMVVSHLREDYQTAQHYRQSILQRLLESWIVALCMSTFFAVIIGLLAWRRITSDYWPNTKSDPESTLTRMDPL